MSKIAALAVVESFGTRVVNVLADLGRDQEGLALLMGHGRFVPNDDARDRVPHGDATSAPAAKRK